MDNVIRSNKAHMTVASGSANNEGWDRRGWDDTLVQTSHGLDPVDADHMIQSALGPAKLYSAEVSKRIQEETGCCPLDIKLLLDLLVTHRGDLAVALRVWKERLCRQFNEEYWPTLSYERLKLFIEGVLTDRPTFMDKRFMALPTTGPLVSWVILYRNPFIKKHIKSWSLLFRAMVSIQ
jgi:hypothetical protein